MGYYLVNVNCLEDRKLFKSRAHGRKVIKGLLVNLLYLFLKRVEKCGTKFP